MKKQLIIATISSAVISLIVSLAVATIKDHLPSMGISGSGSGPSRITVAAANSTKSDKEAADLVCTGKDDQQVIQKAIDSLGDYGEVYLMSGTYMLSALTDPGDGTPLYAIGIPSSALHKRSHIRLTGQMAATEHVPDLDAPVNGVMLVMSQNCYDGLGKGQTCSLVRATGDNRKSMLYFQNISMSLPDSQKDIICIDGSRFESIFVSHSQLFAYPFSDTSYSTKAEPHVGTDGCIGLKGVMGSNNSFEFYLEHVDVYGFGQGFALGGEHCQVEYCGAVFCKWGFTVNNYPLESGVWVHPITLTNCCEEACCNYLLLGPNSGRQAIDIVNHNVEHYPNWFALGGDYARETEPGTWMGNMDYTIMDFEGETYFHENDPTKPYWQTDGSGKGILSRNNAQEPSATSELRRTWAPNYFQSVYDTTLRKMLYCTDPLTRTWVDALGRKVD